ncbi:MAG: beta-hydroxyacyl-ACP dehydratase [Desulforhopalus sp.]|nr:beta-hydroxyacyl-ACP dehydratase [Desulforhopalus sp.]
MENSSLYGAMPECCLCVRLETLAEQHLQVVADFCFPPGYAGFQGHFPNQPLLPAIVQMAMVRYLAERTVQASLMPGGYRKVKFTGKIVPGDTVSVVADMQKNDQGWAVKFNLKKTDGQAVAAGFVQFLQ